MYYIDTANIQTIETCLDTYFFLGVTTNPSLMAKERRTDYLHHLKDIRKKIDNKQLFIQVNAEDFDGMIKEIESFKKHLDAPYVIKVPATKAGFKCMKSLSGEIPIAATAISGYHQALMAISAGAKYVIIYVNRMISSGLQPFDLLSALRQYITKNDYDVTLIGASFKSVDEVTKALQSGAHYVTINPTLCDALFLKPLSERSVKSFSKDFYDRYKKHSISE